MVKGGQPWSLQALSWSTVLHVSGVEETPPFKMQMKIKQAKLQGLGIESVLRRGA